jgi:hypothetical protein
MKALNPQNRWKTAKAAAMTKKAISVKRKEWKLYNESYCFLESVETKETRDEVFLKRFEDDGLTMHAFSPVCFYRRHKENSWRRELWLGGCHWASRIYLIMARKAYPEYHWVRVEGKEHSSCFGFKTHPGKLAATSILHRTLIPDVSYDLIAWAYKLDPLAWVVDGKQVDV